MFIFSNPARGHGLPGLDAPRPSVDAAAVTRLLAGCPAAQETPLRDLPHLAGRVAGASVTVKDERTRMGLGSFKALGAAYVIARDAAAGSPETPCGALSGTTYVAGSAGNHGLSVAAGAQIFGAGAVIYLAESVPEAFADRLRGRNARVVRCGADYEASMEGAARAADTNGWTLLSDSSWPGYLDIPHRVMEGYLQMAAETVAAMPEPPSHILLQAGVGGMAAAVAAYARAHWGEAPTIIVVEPEAAPALLESLRAGRVIKAAGPVSVMGRLDCKEPSLIALAALARDADVFATISEAEAEAVLPELDAAGIETTPSGGAGLAALLAAEPHRAALRLTPDSRVLGIVSEGTEDA